MTYRVTRRARRDILGIWRYIAEDNERAADRLVDLLTRYFQLLGDNPRAGRRRDELRRDYRSFPAGEYLILYRVMRAGCLHHACSARPTGPRSLVWKVEQGWHGPKPQGQRGADLCHPRLAPRAELG
jgi:toxin ParE1/3/4